MACIPDSERDLLTSAASHDRLSQVRSALTEERLKVLTLVVGISPAAAVPLFRTIVQGDFGIDAVLQVDAMVSIFGRDQHQLGFGDVARIDINRALLGVVDSRSVGSFQVVRYVLGVCDFARIKQRFVGKKLLLQIGAHRFGIETCLSEVEDGAFQFDGPPNRFRLLYRPIESVCVTTGNGRDQENRSGLFDLSHVSGNQGF